VFGKVDTFWTYHTTCRITQRWSWSW
jgi:hypothetical protein